MRISCVIQTRNAEADLGRALASVAWADEVLVADMASEDGTVDVAAAHGARVIPVPVHPRVDAVRNASIDRAAHDWILVLDADEYLAADAGPALRAMLDDRRRRHDVFRLPRINYIAGQPLRGSRWYPDYQTRLFRRGTVRWSDAHHRPPTIVAGARVLSLRPPECVHVHHVSYRSIREFVERQTRYALTQRYDPDPASFDFARYLAEAHQEFALRDDRARDGDLAHALAHLMAWDAVVRGVLHWDAVQPRPALDPAAALSAASRDWHAPRARMRRWIARRDPVAYPVRRLVEWWHNRRRAPKDAP